MALDAILAPAARQARARQTPDRTRVVKLLSRFAWFLTADSTDSSDRTKFILLLRPSRSFVQNPFGRDEAPNRSALF
jgi:hypothetical protein